MDESGINLSFDLDDKQLEEMMNYCSEDSFAVFDFPELDYHEIRSKAAPLTESPSLKTEMAKSRTQLKQQLMRDQELQRDLERKKAEELAKSHKPAAEPVKVPFHLPNIAEIPKDVIKVQTLLEHPTKFHIIEKQKTQLKQYIYSSQQDDPYILFRKTEGVQSAPIQEQHKLKPKYQQPSSSYTAVPSPEVPSPGLNSVATSAGTSDADDVLEGILSYEASSLASDSIELQTQSMFGSMLSIDTASRNKNSNSCPSGLEHFKQEAQSYGEVDLKDRMKKDNHNMIERKRRYNINDRIKELGDLLPKNNDPHYDIVRDCRQNKGAILKSSVDYVKALKSDINKLKQVEVDNKQLQTLNRKLVLRIQELERQARVNGLPVDNSQWKVLPRETIINTIINKDSLNNNNLHQKIPDVVCEANFIQADDIMEDDQILRKDTMLCSPISQKSSSSQGSHFYDEDMDVNMNS